MKPDLELNLGPQPLAKLLERYELKAHDLVAASTEQITHKMVTRATKGRRLSAHVKTKILNALNRAAQKEHKVGDLFTY